MKIYQNNQEIHECDGIIPAFEYVLRRIQTDTFYIRTNIIEIKLQPKDDLIEITTDDSDAVMTGTREEFLFDVKVVKALKWISSFAIVSAIAYFASKFI